MRPFNYHIYKLINVQRRALSTDLQLSTYLPCCTASCLCYYLVITNATEVWVVGDDPQYATFRQLGVMNVKPCALRSPCTVNRNVSRANHKYSQGIYGW